MWLLSKNGWILFSFFLFFSFSEGKELIWVITNKCTKPRSSKIGAEGKGLGRQDCEAGQKHIIKIQHGKTSGGA